jgi:hypothetical protein
MRYLNPAKLTTTFIEGTIESGPIIPRVYTLTHSDFTGDLFLTIGHEVNKKQILGFYTRFMRDEVWAEWIEENGFSVLVHCHVSGGLILGGVSWRYAILNEHLPMVLEAFRYGDRVLFERYPALDDTPINVRFHSHKEKFDRLIPWSTFRVLRI